jgi:hypothetical protein
VKVDRPNHVLGRGRTNGTRISVNTPYGPVGVNLDGHNYGEGPVCTLKPGTLDCD